MSLIIKIIGCVSETIPYVLLEITGLSTVVFFFKSFMGTGTIRVVLTLENSLILEMLR